MKKGKSTLFACYLGYIVQAIVNNFAPLLFLTFASSYSLSLSDISLLITINFLVQLLVDLLSAYFIDKIGYRLSAVLAAFFSFSGLLLLSFLPEILPSPYLGILLSIVVYAFGGGLLEVLLSPIVEAIPSGEKEKRMSLLHSFYSWGQAGVILLSTAFFFFFSTSSWRLLSCLWAIFPLIDLFLFLFVPLYPLIDEEEKKKSEKGKSAFLSPFFWAYMLMMFASGASELVISQWASTFAEMGLGLNKSLGDLLGPMAFALFMGSSRLLYGMMGERLSLSKCMMGSAVLCLLSYLLISLSKNGVVGLIGCSLIGFSVGILWPGTFAKAAKRLKRGGSAVFALLALAGDLGAAIGPTAAGLLSSSFGDDLRIGILFSSLFPLLLILSLLFESHLNKKKASIV